MRISEDLEALKLALKSEEDGHKFYKQAEGRVESALAKTVFAALAQEEFEHIEIIKRFYSSLEEKREWPSLGEDKAPRGMAGNVRTVFEEASEKLEEHVKVEAADRQAYDTAMEMENAAYSLYARLLQEAEGEKAKELYRFMCQLEKEHWDLLADTVLYLDNPRQWFFLHERPVIEG